MAEVEVPRDRYGRPMIVPPKGGKPVPYTRTTTVAGSLDDGTALVAWKLRMAAAGLTLRPDLLLAASAHVAEQKEEENANGTGKNTSFLSMFF